MIDCRYYWADSVVCLVWVMRPFFRICWFWIIWCRFNNICKRTRSIGPCRIIESECRPIWSSWVTFKKILWACRSIFTSVSTAFIDTIIWTSTSILTMETSLPTLPSSYSLVSHWSTPPVRTIAAALIASLSVHQRRWS